MSLLRLSLAYLRRRWTTALLNVLLFAIGSTTVALLLLFDHQLHQRLSRDAEGIDMVVGAKGSPLQIILSNVYHVDVPTGNIPLAEAEKLKSNPLVRSTIPLALGDSAGGFRIVGTTHDYVSQYGAVAADGGLWQRPMEVTVGAEVARTLGLKVGVGLVGSHGLVAGGSQHEEAPYRVVGVLAPSHSVLDRLVLTDVRSVWQVHEAHHDDATGHDDAEAGGDTGHDAHPADHEHRGGEADPPTGSDDNGTGIAATAVASDEAGAAHREITALLIKYRSPLAAALLPRVVNARANLQAASPAFETARLLNLVGVGTDTLRAFGALLIAASTLGVLVGLYNALRERRYDLAILRTLGATRMTLMWHVIIESVLLVMAGALLGMLLAHLSAEAAGRWIPRATDLGLTGAIWLPQETLMIGIALVIGVIAALVPAIQAYRLDIARVLARG